ncbi:MAG: 30S ribosomal protein S8e [Candidatus Pacearchaeota archaeon]
MTLSHWRSRRKPTGGLYRHQRKKKLHDLGKDASNTKMGALKRKILRVRGANQKSRLFSCDVVNLFDPKTKKCSLEKIKTVVDNPANRHFVRRNIITKSSIILTEKGKAKVTSRPGQDGMINAILIE